MLLAAVVPKSGKQCLFGKETDDTFYFRVENILDFLFGVLVIERTLEPSMLLLAEVGKPSSVEYRFNNDHDAHDEYEISIESNLAVPLYKLNDWVIRPVISFCLDRYMYKSEEPTLYNGISELFYSISGYTDEHECVDMRNSWANGVIGILDAYVNTHRSRWTADNTKWAKSWIFNNLLVSNDTETNFIFRRCKIDDLFASVKYVQSKVHPILYKDLDCIRTLEYGIWMYHYMQHGADIDQAYKTAEQRLDEICRGRLQLWKNNCLYTPYDKHFSQRIIFKTIMSGRYDIYA